METGGAQEPWVGELENRIGYRFRDQELLLCALTHSSFRGGEGNQDAEYNERLEFLGDAVIGFLVSESLYRLFPALPEGKLSRVRSNLVRAENFSSVAEGLDLGRYLRLGPGEEKTGGRSKQTLLANALEALVAALYLDGGTDAAARFVREHLLREVEEQGPDSFAAADCKTALQEFLQARRLPAPRYQLVRTRGPDHSKTFLVELWVGERMLADGRGASKKAAEQEAARRGTELLAQEEETPRPRESE